MSTTLHPVTPERLAEAFDYARFQEMTESLLAEGKTTGENHSEKFLHFTQMTLRRMKRLDKTAKIGEELSQELENLDEDWVWLVLVEAWCGDVGQNLPVIKKMADLNERIELKLLLRDENPEVINAYLTNGGKGIPKMVCFRKSDLKELGTWGPRPAPAQAMVMAHKADPQEDYMEFVKRVQVWYRDDKTKTVQAELLEKVREWKTV